MGPLSPYSNPSHLSPRPIASNTSLTFNSFSPLSPDLLEIKLQDANGEDEMRKILSIADERLPNPEKFQRHKMGPVIYYSRERLLRIAKRCQAKGWKIPRDMSGLGTWFGMPSPAQAFHVQQLEDPAIAPIGPSAGSSSRRGGAAGYGEGFGYGGGIGGGKGIARGGRNIGLRRTADGQLDANGLPLPSESRRDAFGGQMGRFSVRNLGDRNMKLGGDEAGKGKDGSERKGRKDDGEWRRSERGSAPPHLRCGDESRRPQNAWNNRYVKREQGPQEPAWMDDQQDASTGLTDAVTQEASILDPLVKFMPGEDMIAAHKRAMKAREAEGDWRGGTKPLISFFGTDPAIASLSAASEPQPGLTVPSPKPRNFNAADYLRPTSQQSEEDKKEADEPDPASNAFQSRFQRFFGGPSPTSALTSGSPGVIKEREQTVFSPPIHSPPEILSPSQRSYGDTTDRDEAYKPDDHVATLMGLLSSKVSGLPAPVQASPDDRSSQSFSHSSETLPSHMQFHDYQRPELQRAPLRTDTTQRSYLSSPTRLHRPSGAPPNDSRRGMPLDFQGQGSNSHPIHYDYELGSGHSQSFRPPLNHPHDLQQLNNPHKSPTNDEQSRHAASMQTAAQAQRPQQIMLSPSGHQSVPLGIYNRAMPPGYRPSANMYPHQARDEGGIAPHDFLRDLPSQSQGFPRSGSRDYQSTPSTLYPGGPPRPGLQGFIPTQFPLSGGPRPPSDMFQAGSIFQSDNYSRYGPPPPGLGPGSGQLGASQQDMLATLFAGLGPRGGAGG